MSCHKNDSVCILVLCGLPGCGKTTFSKALSQKISSRYHTIHVCYDAIFPSANGTENERLFITSTPTFGFSDESSPWKSDRKDILHLVRERIAHQRGHKLFPTGYADGRIVNSAIRQQFSDCVPVTKTSHGNRDHVWIIDDNMYYRSMRYEYYQLAREFQVGYSIVYLKCSLEDARARNSGRAEHSRVPDAVIDNMFTKFEAPDPLCHWEKQCVVIDAVNASHRVNDVLQLIDDSFKKPVQPVPEEDFELKEECRRCCSTNLLHQTDQILRTLVSLHMQQLKETGASKSALQVTAKKMNCVKTAIVDKVKQGKIETLRDYKEENNASKNQDSVLFKSIQSLFNRDIT